MSGHKNVIELNGKLYDTVSGTIVHAPAPSSQPAQPVVIKPQSKGTVLDGVRRSSSAPVHHVTPKPKATPQAPRAAIAHKKHTPAEHVPAHTPHRAKTLMRRGLKKPTLHESARHHDQQGIVNPLNTNHRLERAKTVPQSPKISRFGSLLSQQHHFVKKAAPLQVKVAPVHSTIHKEQPVSHHAAAPIPNNNQILKEHLVSQAIKNARVPEVHHTKPKKHKMAKKIGVSPKVFHFGAGTFAALLLIGFIAYQNAPNISMRIAASRAGFNAAIPSYQPSGFGMNGPIEYGPGQVTLNFKSNSDERNFHVTQRVSSWNSEALLTNFVTTNNKSYQTYQDKGRTIYIYDGSNATWVSNGVWYQIEGKSNLSSDQLIKLANSI